MVTTERPGAMRKLVDSQKGEISRELFVSQEIYDQEIERVFTKSWLLVGFESQVPNPNDIFVSRMGEESVLLTRDKQGDIHVLLNTCRHRGMKVCRYDETNSSVLTCPYHGWSYSTDGKLVQQAGALIGVPQFQSGYNGELKKEDWGLISVPKMYVYKGSVWANWDQDAPEFLDYLGGMRPLLDNLFVGSDGQDPIAIGGVLKWQMPANWKFASENFAGDHYHLISHRSSEIAGWTKRVKGDQRSVPVEDEPGAVFYTFPYGHCSWGQASELWRQPAPFNEAGVRAAAGRYSESDELLEYRRSSSEAYQKMNGGRGPMTGPTTIFPNMSAIGTVTAGGQRAGLCIAVWHPVGPQMTEAWRWLLLEKDLSPEVRAMVRGRMLPHSGPVGMFESDDMENWNYATEASAGTIARRYPYHYAQGMGRETTDPALPDATITVGDTSAPSEQNQRNLLSFWADMMDTESWADLRQG